MRLPPRFRLPILVAVLAGCGGGSEPAGPPTGLVAVNPGPFTGTVGEDLSAALQVRVRDADDRGVPGVAVGFTVTAGGGTVSVGALGGTSITDTTDQDGIAEVSWALGTVAGEQGASASVTGLATVTFLATAAAGAPAGSVVEDGSAFIAPVSSPTDEPLVVRVEDTYGNVVAGALVSWTALSAGAGVSAASSTTNADGIAQIGATLGAAPGVYLFEVTPEGAGPDTIGVIGVRIVTDSTGDQAPVANPAYDSHDVTRFGAAVVQDFLVLYARFAGTVSPNPVGTPTRSSLVANYDLDLDGDSLTGYLTLRQCLGGPPVGFGADAFVDLDPNSGFLVALPSVPAGAVAVLRVDALLEADRCTSSFNGALYAAVPAYRPTSVSLAVPLSFFEDDGAVSVTNLFAHPATGVTDVVPDSLAWDFVPTAAAAAGAPGADAPDPWAFLPVPRPTGRVFPIERMRPPRRLPRR